MLIINRVLKIRIMKVANLCLDLDILNGWRKLLTRRKCSLWNSFNKGLKTDKNSKKIKIWQVHQLKTNNNTTASLKTCFN